MVLSKLLIVKISKIKRIFIYFLLFFIIYFPPIKYFIISPEYILLAGFAIWFVLNPNSFYKFISHRVIFTFLILLLLLVTYSLLLNLIFSPSQDVPIKELFHLKIIRLIINFLLIIGGLVNIIIGQKWNRRDLYRAFIYISTIQSIIAIFMIAMPSFKSMVLNSILNLKDSNVFLLDNTLSVRIFGIASEYLFAYPLFQGLVLIIIFNLALEGEKKYLVYSPLIIISILFNARIGLVSLLSFSFVVLITILISKYRYRILKSSFKLSFLITLILSIVAFVVFRFVDLSNYWISLKWILSGFEKGNFAHSDVILNRFLFFPENTHNLWFGHGEYVFYTTKFGHSDIGYIILIFFGGIIFTFVYMYSFIWFFLSSWNKFDIYYKILIWSCVMMIFLANIKGLAISNNGFIRAMLIISTFNILRTNNFEKLNETK